jgi:hypothetical protein
MDRMSHERRTSIDIDAPSCVRRIFDAEQTSTVRGRPEALEDRAEREPTTVTG